MGKKCAVWWLLLFGDHARKIYTLIYKKRHIIFLILFIRLII
jgi:hypothetical protein